MISRLTKCGWAILSASLVLLSSCGEGQKHFNHERAELRIGDKTFWPRSKFLRDPPVVNNAFNVVFDLGANEPVPSDCIKNQQHDCVWAVVDKGTGMGRRALFMSTSLKSGNYRVTPLDNGLVRYESRHRRNDKVVGTRMYLPYNTDDNLLFSCWETGLSYSDGTTCEGWLLENGLDIHFIFPTRYLFRWRDILRDMRIIIEDARRPSSTTDFGDRQ